MFSSFLEIESGFQYPPENLAVAETRGSKQQGHGPQAVEACAFTLAVREGESLSILSVRGFRSDKSLSWNPFLITQP
jgi:hypothetical protein